MQLNLQSGPSTCLGDCEGWAPLLLQDIKADAALCVYVRVIDLGLELDLWWLEGIVWWKVYEHKEDASSVWTVTWAHDRSLQQEESEAVARPCSAKAMTTLALELPFSSLLYEKPN